MPNLPEFVVGGVFYDLAHMAKPPPLALELLAQARIVTNHPVHHQLTTYESVVSFMEYQVWCVWDFMSIAKAVQVGVGAYSIPWVPPQDASLVAAINEIIGGEEADIGPNGAYQSHFEIYLAAMRQAQANTRAIDRTVELVRRGSPPLECMRSAGAPEAAQRFVAETLSLCDGPLHVRMAGLCLGREELVPQMFTTLLNSNLSQDPRLGTFVWYVRRHVNLDSESHGPLCARMLRRLTAGSPQRMHEALEAGLKAVRARRVYLDALLPKLQPAVPDVRQGDTP